MIRKHLLVALVVGAVAAPGAQAQGMARGDLVQTAVAGGQFSTLVKAVQAAGLVETLQGPGPFTVFAPTDAAFAKLPAGALDRLLANPEQLRAVLLYHVVPGRVSSAQAVKLDNARTAQGGSVPIRVTASRVSIGSAGLVWTDLDATNGVIHVIDSVLLPPAAH